MLPKIVVILVLGIPKPLELGPMLQKFTQELHLGKTPEKWKIGKIKK